MSNPHPPLTWGQVKAWAESNEVPDSAEVTFDAGQHFDYEKVRDLSSWEAEGGEPPIFILQKVWG